MTRDQLQRIVQIAPQIAPGSGVGGVAYALEEQFTAAGVWTERFTLAEARGRAPRKRRPGGALARLDHAWDVVWFSTVGTVRAKRFLAARPDAISICHNDVFAGDIYVNHGLLLPAMKARGHFIWRMIRNPLHLFTTLRDRVRYRGHTHRMIVVLSAREAALLRATFGAVGAPIEVIPNGVDSDRFRPATAAERTDARSALEIGPDQFVVLFIGHEFDRKGLPIILQALLEVPDATLLVVGGDPAMIASASRQADRLGVSGRVRFVGVQADPVPFLWAADAFALLSAYEANALVILEALACGLPVLSSHVGAADDLIVDGENGFLIERSPDAAAAALRAAAAREWSTAPRASAERHSWGEAARRYLDVAGRLKHAGTAHT